MVGNDIVLLLPINICYRYSLQAPLMNMLLISTHNICFCGEIRNIITVYLILLSFRAMEVVILFSLLLKCH